MYHYGLTFDILADKPHEIAGELDLPVRYSGCEYTVLFTTESDLIAFRDLVEELYDV